ncbi:MAG TPA: ATP-dependent helicase HrpB, partial [Alphaproteobacteria bacterium]|nr:ATP-dependent helicase HrpB [Alphaproteobacteria bacterium]
MTKPPSPPATPSASLPIDAALPELLAALAAGPAAVLQAPPGAGKTTKVPLALLDAPWLAGRKIVMLEPRRLAARAAARRMAQMLGEAVGETVGYRVRLDTRVGPKTRIEVVTEGLFVRQLQGDPELADVGAVLFDEFHERSLDADLGLALALETQGALRDDLRLLVMSATLDGAAVAALLGGAPVVTSEGRSHPVETRYLGDRPANQRVEEAVAAAVRGALREERGSVLVFLPGVGEIRRTEALLAGSLPGDAVLAPLYGDLTPEQQDAAIRPAPDGRRKVVLATSIAETSLTIEGIRIVVDSGLSRVPRFDPRSGMARLETVRVSQASADQRRGRAGRLEPGLCLRLWSEAGHRALSPHGAPEIQAADLAPLALDLAQWGVGDPAALAWLDPPPAAAFAQARELLRGLGALDPAGAITPHGKAMAGLGLHPRLAHMVLRGRDLGHGATACDLAALLSERDVVRAGPGARDCDVRLRLDLLRGEARTAHLPPGLALDRGALAQVREGSRQWQRQLGIKGDRRPPGFDTAGRLLAFAYPDRIGQRRPGGGPGGGTGYRLSGGRGAVLAEGDPLAAEAWIAVADLDGAARDARVFLAAPLTQAAIEEDFAAEIATVQFVAWEPREGAVLARRQRRLWQLVLKDEPLADPAPEAVAAALIEGIRALGLGVLPWTPELQAWRARIAFLRRVEGEAGGWPDLSDAALLATLEAWLAPFLGGITRRGQFGRIDLGAALRSHLDWNRQKALDELAPTHLTVPSGSRIPLDYSAEEPVLAVRLQE